MSLLEKARGFHPSVQKILGVCFVILGFLALITPLTPGSWLALIGFELLGIRFLFLDKLYAWLKSRKQKDLAQK